jgi:hypothetical protein
MTGKAIEINSITPVVKTVNTGPSVVSANNHQIT